VVVHPKVDEHGELHLEVSNSRFELNEDNFKVNNPERCDVAFGLNWLVRWALPWLIESYKETISDALSSALAKGLVERTTELSPYLTLNVLLPFEGQEVPSFNVELGVQS
jgi:hypothetical protein